MAELTKEQKDIIRLIEKEAKKAGIDPDFAVAIASLESGFRHIPATDKKSTAFGPLQVNKATAEANGVDYEEMKKSPELAVRTGIMNLVRHANNPKFEGDPLRIAAAHRYGENSEFAKTGDPKFIDKTLAGYLADAMDHFPEQSFPERVYTKPSEKPVGEEMDMGTVPLGSEAPIAGEGEQLDMGSQPLEGYSAYDQNAADRRLAAAQGAGVGTLFGAVKVPAIGLYKKAYDLLQEKTRAKDVGAIMEAANKINEANAAGQAGGQGLRAPTAVEPTGPNAKYTAKFGQGVQLTPAEIASATGMGKGDTEAWGLIKKAREANQKIDALTGAGSYTLDPERGLLVDTSVGGGARGAQRAPTPMAPSPQKQAQALADYEAWANAQNAAGREPSRLARGVGTVVGSSPVKFGLAGAGVGYNIEDATQKFSEGDYLGGLGSLGAAGASGLTLVPKYAARANPAAIGLTTGSQMYSDIKAGKPQEAAEAGLTGATALLPRIFGPLSAALYSRGLNAGEKEELERRRMMQPTITRP